MFLDAIVLFEQVFPFGDLDIMATFRVEVEQMPDRPWRIVGVEALTQHGSWEPLIPGTALDVSFRFYAQGVGSDAVMRALYEAQAEATEAARSDAGDVREAA